MVTQRMRSAVQYLDELGGLKPINLAVRSFPAHILRRFVRYVAFQWLNTAGEGRLKMEQMRDFLCVLVAETLSDQLPLQSSVWSGNPVNFIAPP